MVGRCARVSTVTPGRRPTRPLTRLQADRLIGRRVGGSNETVGTYLIRWLEEVAKGRVRDTTYDGYEYLIRMYLVPEFGRFRMSKLRASDVRRGLLRLKGVCQCCRQGRDLARLQRARAEEKTACRSEASQQRA